LFILALCEHDQAALRVVALGLSGQERVETLCHLLQSEANRIRAVYGIALLDDGAEEHSFMRRSAGNDLAKFCQDSLTQFWINAPPETVTGTNRLRVEIYWWSCRKVSRFDEFSITLHPIRPPLEHSKTREDEMAITGVVGVTRFVDVQQIDELNGQKKGG